MDLEDELPTTLSWAEHGRLLAIGTRQGNLYIWDVTVKKMVLEMSGHISSLTTCHWNDQLLASGCSYGNIYIEDIRMNPMSSNGIICECNGHVNQICGLQWSADRKYLASGGNDQQVMIWELQASTLSIKPTSSSSYFRKPLHVFTEHTAAVRALAWSPHHTNVLATGGGMKDGHIRLWNIHLGKQTHSIDTNSQVSYNAMLYDDVM